MEDEKLFDLFCEKLGIIGIRKEIFARFNEIYKQKEIEEKEELKDFEEKHSEEKSSLYFDEFIWKRRN